MYGQSLRKVIMDKSHLRNKFIQNGNRENWYEDKKLRTEIKIKNFKKVY